MWHNKQRFAEEGQKVVPWKLLCPFLREKRDQSDSTGIAERGLIGSAFDFGRW
jgi:hypothetical protein